MEVYKVEQKIEKVKSTLYLIIALMGAKISLRMMELDDKWVLLVSIIVFLLSIIMECYLCYISKTCKDSNESERMRKDLRNYHIAYIITITGTLFTFLYK